MQHRLAGNRFVELAKAAASRLLDWRLLVCGLIIGLSLLPTLWLALSSFPMPSFTTMLTGPVVGALKRSLLLLAATAGLALLLGWPAGTLVGLVRFPLRSFFLAALALPVLTPSSL